MVVLEGGDLVLGGVVGVLFQELYKGIKGLRRIYETFISFEPLHRDLDSKLKQLKPLIKEIENYNTKLKLPPYAGMKDLETEMERGIKFVSKCSAVGDWTQLINCTELDNLSKSLTHQLNIAQMVRDDKENLYLTRDTNKTISEFRGFISTAKYPWEDKGLQDVSSTNKIKIEASSSLPVGLDVPLKELKMKLLTDDQVPIHVLTGLGGCGKTTLAKHFYEDNEVKGTFKDNIFVITVPKDLKPDSILSILHKNSRFPATPDVVPELLLNTGGQTMDSPVLLVLDDVWSESEFFLKNLDKLKRPNWKILVTSRFEFQKFSNCPYYVNLLNDEDAITLFLDSASRGGQANSSVSEYLVRKIVGHLKGLPLALRVVGTAFGKISLENWHERLKAWSTGSLVLDFESDELLTCLQRSFDDMDRTSEIKECFISLASFPKGQKIPVVALNDMWADSDNQLSNHTIDLDNNHEFIAKLQELTKRSLANLIPTRSGTWDDTDGYYSEHFIIQHDMLRELSIYQLTRDEDSMEQNKSLIIDVFENNFPEWWTKQEHDQPVRARLLSISTDSVFSTKWPSMEVPEVQVLVLNFQSSNYAMPKFVEKMENLRVLIITNYGVSKDAELSYFQLLNSLLMLKRIRLDRISFHSIMTNSLVLMNLQKLSLFMCKVGEAFSNCSSPCPFPNLVELNIDYCIDLVILPMVVHLIHLKTLSISSCHKLSALPEKIGNHLVHLQVLRLRVCTGLEKLPDSVTKLQELIILDLSNCCSLTELPGNIGDLRSLLKLDMRQCSRLRDLPDSVRKLENLVVISDGDELAMQWQNLPHLSGRSIRVVKEDFNLNWLAKPLSANHIVARMDKGEMTDSAPKFNTLIDKLLELEGEIDAVQDAVKDGFSTVNDKIDGITKDEFSTVNDKIDVITNLLSKLITAGESSGTLGRRDSKPAHSSSYSYGSNPNNYSNTGLLQFNSKVVSEQTSSQFNTWVKRPNATCNLEICDGSSQWFLDLTSGKWLTDTHIDVHLHFLRKSRPQSLSQSCNILDTVFWSKMKGRWEDFQKEPSSYVWGSDILDYPLGESPKYTRPWSEVDYLFLPVNVREHWVAVCGDLMRRKFTIYDSMLSATQDEIMYNELKPLATMFPSLLIQSEFYGKRPELRPLETPFKVVRPSDDIPQQSSGSGDCGVFMLKFVEYLSLGHPLSFGQADMQNFRKQMALELFVMSEGSGAI